MREIQLSRISKGRTGTIKRKRYTKAQIALALHAVFSEEIDSMASKYDRKQFVYLEAEEDSPKELLIGTDLDDVKVICHHHNAKGIVYRSLDQEEARRMITERFRFDTQGIIDTRKVWCRDMMTFEHFLEELSSRGARELAVQIGEAVTHDGPIPAWSSLIPDDPAPEYSVITFDLLTDEFKSISREILDALVGKAELTDRQLSGNLGELLDVAMKPVKTSSGPTSIRDQIWPTIIGNVVTDISWDVNGYAHLLLEHPHLGNYLEWFSFWEEIAESVEEIPDILHHPRVQVCLEDRIEELHEGEVPSDTEEWLINDCYTRKILGGDPVYADADIYSRFYLDAIGPTNQEYYFILSMRSGYSFTSIDDNFCGCFSTIDAAFEYLNEYGGSFSYEYHI